MPSARPARRLLAPALLVIALALGACGSDDRSATQDGAQAPASKSAREAAQRLERQAGQFLDGGPDAFRAQLAALRGIPVVVNQWASWCGPCRFELPFFAAVARKYVGRVAFLGVNAKDNREAAAAFLKDHPVPFPHFADDDLSISRVFRGGRAFPTTAFYDAAGELTFTHAGAFPSEEKLDEAIREYALDG